MKVNPIGIDAYRQAMDKPQVENRAAATKKEEAAKTSQVQIPGQVNKIGSKLAVKLKPGTFVDMLSAEEKKAFELVFEKFRQLTTADGAYSKNGENNRQTTGNFVDVTL